MQERAVAGSRIDALLEAVWRAGGTDLLLTVGQAPQQRVHGDLSGVWGYPQLTADDTDVLLAELLTPAEAATLSLRQEHDFSFTWRDMARVRGNAFSQRGYTAIALRVIPRQVPTMEQLSLPPALYDFTRQHQ